MIPTSIGVRISTNFHIRHQIKVLHAVFERDTTHIENYCYVDTVYDFDTTDLLQIFCVNLEFRRQDASLMNSLFCSISNCERL